MAYGNNNGQQKTFSGPPKKQNALNEYKLKLVAAPHDKAIERNGRSMPPTMSLSVHDNQPRLTVYTNVQDDAQDGKIEGNMDTYTFYAVLEAVREAAADPEWKPVYFHNKGHFFTREGRSEEPGIKSSTIIGRNAEGAVYIALVAKNRPNIQFVFAPSEWHDLIDSKGNRLSQARISELYAKATVNAMQDLTAEILNDEFISYQAIKERKDANAAARGKGGGGGGYSNNRSGGSANGYGGGNNGGGGRPAPAAPEFDEDMPF